MNRLLFGEDTDELYRMGNLDIVEVAWELEMWASALSCFIIRYLLENRADRWAIVRSLVGFISKDSSKTKQNKVHFSSDFNPALIMTVIISSPAPPPFIPLPCFPAMKLSFIPTINSKLH